jgi:hypothetical protein
VLEELFALGTPVLAGKQPWTPRKALHVLGPTALPVAFRGGEGSRRVPLAPGL